MHCCFYTKLTMKNYKAVRKTPVSFHFCLFPEDICHQGLNICMYTLSIPFAKKFFFISILLLLELLSCLYISFSFLNSCIHMDEAWFTFSAIDGYSNCSIFHQVLYQQCFGKHSCAYIFVKTCK